MKTVLVVGGAGYIGSMLIPALIERGHTVRLFDCFYFSMDSIRPYLNDIEVIQGDMRYIPRNAVAGVDAVINLGGLSNDPTANYDPVANWTMNYEAVVALAKLCKELHIPRFIFASSCSVYDQCQVTPLGESLRAEEDSLQPIGHYCEAKYAAERALLTLADAEFGVVILRKGTVFGYSPRMRFDLVVNTMVRDALVHGAITIHGTGAAWRPLIEVRDVADAYVRILESSANLVHNQVFNILSQNLQIGELGRRVQATLQLAGIPCVINKERSQSAMRSYRVSGEKAKQILNYSPTISIEESVKDLVSRLRHLSVAELNHPRHFNIRWMQLLQQEGASVWS